MKRVVQPSALLAGTLMLVGIVLVPSALYSLLTHSTAYAAYQAYLRVNQVGYVTTESKHATLLTPAKVTNEAFAVIAASSGKTVLSGKVGSTSNGKWNSAFTATSLLDFSSVTAPGSYYLRVSGTIAARSPIFRIDTAVHLYTPLLANALFFYQAQRDGPNVNSKVMDRQPSHLTDASASIYATPTYDSNDVLQGTLQKIGGPIDVSGGWFDAGDYVKFVETASYTDAIMLFAARQYPGLVGSGSNANFNAEGRYGLDWLQKMWHESSKTLYYQVGIGDGNGNSTLGDHDFWRLPQADDQMNVKPSDPAYYVKYRPVFQAGPAGSAISPNLAGRLAADFALCYQVYASSNRIYANQCLMSAETIFALAQTSNVGQLLTTAPHDYYPETEWRDDMELGATELYNALALGGLPSGLPHTDPHYYLSLAAHWAHAYITGPNDGADTLNLYDVSGLAHYDLYHAIAKAGNPGGLEVTKAQLLTDLGAQLSSSVTQAQHDPFGLGFGYTNGDIMPHALGLALEAGFYDQLAGNSTYAAFGKTQRDWSLGNNAWGSTFIVGAGSTFPHCMQSQIANLSGSLDGKRPIMLGATTDGPSATSNFNGLGFQTGMRKCPPGSGDPFRQFSGKGVRYFDNVIAWPSVEPADDYTALTIVLFASQI